MGRRGGGSNSKIFLIVAGVIALGIGVGAVLVVRRNQSAPYRIKKLKAEVSVHVRRGKPELAAKKLVTNGQDLGRRGGRRGVGHRA